MVDIKIWTLLALLVCHETVSMPQIVFPQRRNQPLKQNVTARLSTNESNEMGLINEQFSPTEVTKKCRTEVRLVTEDMEAEVIVEECKNEREICESLGEIKCSVVMELECKPVQVCRNKNQTRCRTHFKPVLKPLPGNRCEWKKVENCADAETFPGNEVDSDEENLKNASKCSTTVVEVCDKEPKQQLVYETKMICDQVEVRQCQKQLENSSAEDSSQRLRGDPSSPESKEESAASHESLIDSTSSSPPGKRQPVASRSSEEASPTCAYVPKTRCEPTERCRNMTSEIASCKKIPKKISKTVTREIPTEICD